MFFMRFKFANVPKHTRCSRRIEICQIWGLLHVTVNNFLLRDYSADITACWSAADVSKLLAPLSLFSSQAEKCCNPPLTESSHKHADHYLQRHTPHFLHSCFHIDLHVNIDFCQLCTVTLLMWEFCFRFYDVRMRRVRRVRRVREVSHSFSSNSKWAGWVWETLTVLQTLWA